MKSFVLRLFSSLIHEENGSFYRLSISLDQNEKTSIDIICFEYIISYAQLHHSMLTQVNYVSNKRGRAKKKKSSNMCIRIALIKERFHLSIVPLESDIDNREQIPSIIKLKFNHSQKNTSLNMSTEQLWSNTSLISYFWQLFDDLCESVQMYHWMRNRVIRWQFLYFLSNAEIFEILCL